MDIEHRENGGRQKERERDVNYHKIVRQRGGQTNSQASRENKRQKEKERDCNYYTTDRQKKHINKQTERQAESNIITEKLQNRREKVDYKNTQQI